MKEITATARNIIGTHDGKEFKPRAEFIVVVSEPTFRIDASGHLIRERGALEAVRFVGDAKGLRHVAKELTDCAEELEAIGSEDSNV